MPQTLFLFIEDLTLEAPFLSLLLDEKGELIAPYEKRSLDSIQALQKNARSYCVLPATIAKPHIVQLPTLKKAALTVPNLLEDDLIQDIDALHFALDTKPSVDQHYHVTVIDKSLLTSLLETLENLALDVDVICHDFLYTADHALYVTERYALLNQRDTAAVFSPDLSAFYQHQDKTSILSFADSNADIMKTIKQTASTNCPTTYHEYFAKQCLQSTACNLLQGAFQKKVTHFNRFPLISYGLALTAFLLFIGAHITQYISYQNQLNTITTQNERLYHVFFPNSKNMVSPRFRIEQRLKSQTNNTSEHAFFDLLNALNQSAANHPDIQLENIQYQDNAMELDIKAQSFALLERFREAFKAHPITIKQLSAKTQRKSVKARWRITL